MLDIGIKIIGYIATVLLGVFNIPQSYKLMKSKDTTGLSLASYTTIIVGGLLFGFSYTLGAMKSLPIFIGEGAFIFFSLPILGYIAKDRKKIWVFGSVIIGFISLYVLGTLSLSFGGTIEIAYSVLTLFGGGMLSVAFLPQTLSFIKKKEVDNFSFPTSALLTAGLLFLTAQLSMLSVGFFEGNDVFAKVSIVISIIYQFMAITWQILMQITGYFNKSKKSK